MSASQPNRVAPGVPSGGRFAPQTSSEAGDIGLSEPTDGAASVPSYPPLKETGRGRFEVTETVSERPPADGRSIAMTRMHIGGQPHRRAHANLAGLQAGRAMMGDRDIQDELQGMAGQKITVLTQGPSGCVEAQEGTVIVDDQGAVGLVDKGASLKGRYIAGRAGGPHLLGFRKGYGKAEELATEYRSFEERVPALEKAHFDDIPVRDNHSEPPSAIHAAFVFDHPGFDESQDGRGCVFLATDQDPDEIVNGYMVASPRSGLTSEHGSFTTDQLSRWGGRVSGFEPGSMNFGDALELGNQSSPYGDADMEPTWDAISRS